LIDHDEVWVDGDDGEEDEDDERDEYDMSDSFIDDKNLGNSSITISISISKDVACSGGLGAPGQVHRSRLQSRSGSIPRSRPAEKAGLGLDAQERVRVYSNSTLQPHEHPLTHTCIHTLTLRVAL
jgi:hypothetical protein